MTTAPVGCLDGEQAIRDALAAFPDGWESAFVEARETDWGGVVHIGHPWEDEGLAEVITVDTENYSDSPAAMKIAAFIVAANPKSIAGIVAELDRLRSASRQEGEEVPEGCTPADARMLRVANHGLAAENDKLREALAFYAEGNHFIQHDPNAWDTVSGEPTNFYEDESNTATVEDGSVAKMALDAVSAPHQAHQAQEAQGDRHGE